MSEWIKCSEKQPPTGKKIIIIIFQDNVTFPGFPRIRYEIAEFAFYRDQGCYYIQDYEGYGIPEYWMEIPELSK